MASPGPSSDMIRNWPPDDLLQYRATLGTKDYGLTYAVFADLALSQAWKDMALHPLGACFRPLLSGMNPKKSLERQFVYSYSSEQSTTIEELHMLFQAIEVYTTGKINKILLAIVHTDSTIVYYSINQGIVKPTVN